MGLKKESRNLNKSKTYRLKAILGAFPLPGTWQSKIQNNI